MKAVAAKRRRFGYRRIGVMLERKGMIMNHKKLYRLRHSTLAGEVLCEIVCEIKYAKNY